MISTTVRYVLMMSLICTIGTSCTSRNIKTDNAIMNSCLQDHEEVIYFSTVFDSFRIIPLESNKNSIIGMIQDIIINDTLVYILDGFQTRSVFLYSINGDLLNTLSKSGRGPGEYINPVSIQLDTKNNRLLLLDMVGKRINQYDPITFEFIKSIETPQGKNFSEFIQIEDELYLYGDYSTASNDEYLIYNTDSQGNLIGKLLKYSDYHPTNQPIPRSTNRRLSKNGNSAIVISTDGKSIYSILKAQVFEYLKIDQDEIRFISYSANNKKELIQTEKNKDLSLILHDELNQAILCGRISTTTDDLTKFKFPRLLGIDGDWVASIVQPVNVKYLRLAIEIDSVKLPGNEKTNLLKRYESYENINNANPTIVLYRLKQ